MSKAKSLSIDERIEMTRQHSEFTQENVCSEKIPYRKPVIYKDSEFENFKKLWRN